MQRTEVSGGVIDMHSSYSSDFEAHGNLVKMYSTAEELLYKSV